MKHFWYLFPTRTGTARHIRNRLRVAMAIRDLGFLATIALFCLFTVLLFSSGDYFAPILALTLFLYGFFIHKAVPALFASTVSLLPALILLWLDSRILITGMETTLIILLWLITFNKHAPSLPDFMSPNILIRVAIHEAGHALVALGTGLDLQYVGFNPKIILPTNSIGKTIFLPSKNENFEKIMLMTLGGVVAEELFFNTVIGGTDDLKLWHELYSVHIWNEKKEISALVDEKERERFFQNSENKIKKFFALNTESISEIADDILKNGKMTCFPINVQGKEILK